MEKLRKKNTSRALISFFKFVYGRKNLLFNWTQKNKLDRDEEISKTYEYLKFPLRWTLIMKIFQRTSSIFFLIYVHFKWDAVIRFFYFVDLIISTVSLNKHQSPIGNQKAILCSFQIGTSIKNRTGWRVLAVWGEENKDSQILEIEREKMNERRTDAATGRDHFFRNFNVGHDN